LPRSAESEPAAALWMLETQSGFFEYR